MTVIFEPFLVLLILQDPFPYAAGESNEKPDLKAKSWQEVRKDLDSHKFPIPEQIGKVTRTRFRTSTKRLFSIEY